MIGQGFDLELCAYKEIKDISKVENIESIVGVALITAFIIFLTFLSKAMKGWQKVIENNTEALSSVDKKLGEFVEANHSCREIHKELLQVMRAK